MIRGIKIFLFAAAVLFINALLFFQAFSAFSKWSLENRRFTIREIYKAPIQRIKAFRLPGHKSGYLFGLKDTEPENQRLYFFSPFKKTQVGVSVILDITTPRDWQFIPPQEIDEYNNGKPVLPLLGVENKKVVLELKDMDGNTRKNTKLENLSIPLPTDKMELAIITIEDIDADGREDLIWRITGGFAGLPRGIAVHDPLSGKKKWEFLFGGHPFMTIAKDIDNDDKKEIIFSVWAPHNGCSHNGMNDDTSYVGVLDCQGKRLWQYAAGGYYSKEHLAVADLDLNDTYEVITARSCHRDLDPDPGQIRVYDALTGKIIHSENYTGISFNDLFVTNMDNDPNLEIISSDIGGGLRIWDQKINTIREFKGDSDIRIMGVERIQENSFPFIFTRYAYNTLRIFDHRLRTIFNYRFPKELTHSYTEPMVRVSDGKNNFFVLTADSTYLISPKQSLSLPDYLKLLRSNFSVYFLGILVLNTLSYIGWRHREKIRERYLDLMRKGKKINPEWTVTAQEVLHKMKSPLTAILWETEKIDGLLEKKRQSKTFLLKLKKINEAILADVNELKLMNRFLMKYLQVQTLRLQEIEITKIITEMVDNYQGTFKDRFTITCNFPPSLPTFLADEEQLKEVLAIIIDNAIDAVPDGGTISITAAFYKMLPHKEQKNILCIEIEDDGCGIPGNNLEKIFDPYYTTKKEGTGIGLAIARRIVESHDGWIEVESKEKVGTKFALYFPVKNLP